MYLGHFQLSQLPFRPGPDPAFLYPSQAHARAKAYMESALWFNDGFVVITGESGVGKTTLVEGFLRELEDDVVVAQLTQAPVSPALFLQALLQQFELEASVTSSQTQRLALLEGFLIEQHDAGHKALLVIDEAQNLTPAVLAELRPLAEFGTARDPLLRIVLAGQPELDGRLDAPELEPLRQRLRLRCQLNALGEAEVAGYVRHRLKVAGATREVFEPDTFQLIHRYTGGLPRLINTLCDTALLTAYAMDRASVGNEAVRDAIGELRWKVHAARNPMRLGPLPEELPELPVHATPPSRATASSHGTAPAGRIVVRFKGSEVARRRLTPGRCVIGRTPDNELQLESKYVSRHHAQFMTGADGSTVLTDLNSTNGVYVDGRRIRRHRLVPGELIRIGLHEITYERAAEHFDDEELRVTATTVLSPEDYADSSDDDEVAALDSGGEPAPVAAEDPSSSSRRGS
jgi:general secretion pathway protein A